MSGRAGAVCGSPRVDGRGPERGSGVGPAPERWPFTSSLALGALNTAPSCARLHAGAVLHEWGLRSLAETAELVVSELVTNAVQASTGPDGKPPYEHLRTGLPVVHLRMSSDGRRVVIEVWDQNPREPVAGQAGLDDESGRGLMIVDALCERWDWKVTPGRPGKVVWGELRT